MAVLAGDGGGRGDDHLDLDNDLGDAVTHAIGYAYMSAQLTSLNIVCPLCGQEAMIKVFVEMWTRLDEDSASKARISTPDNVHTCAKKPDGTFTTWGGDE